MIKEESESLAVSVQADVVAVFARPTLAIKGESGRLAEYRPMFARPALAIKGESGKLAKVTVCP